MSKDRDQCHVAGLITPTYTFCVYFVFARTPRARHRPGIEQMLLDYSATTTGDQDSALLADAVKVHVRSSKAAACSTV